MSNISKLRETITELMLMMVVGNMALETFLEMEAIYLRAIKES